MKKPTNDQQPDYKPQPGQLPPNTTLTGQQFQAMTARYASELVAIRKDIDLRKWAVDQACGLAGSENCIVKDNDPVALARLIHAFLVEGAEKAE